MYTPKRHGSVALSAILLGLGMLVHSQNTYAEQIIREVYSDEKEWVELTAALKKYCPALLKNSLKSWCYGDPGCDPCLKAVRLMEKGEDEPIKVEVGSDKRVKANYSTYTGGKVYANITFQLNSGKWSVKKFGTCSFWPNEGNDPKYHVPECDPSITK